MKENIATFRQYIEESGYEYLDRKWVIWMLDNLVYCEEKKVRINPKWLTADTLSPKDFGKIRGVNSDNI